MDPGQSRTIPSRRFLSRRAGFPTTSGGQRDPPGHRGCPPRRRRQGRQHQRRAQHPPQERQRRGRRPPRERQHPRRARRLPRERQRRGSQPQPGVRHSLWVRLRTCNKQPRSPAARQLRSTTLRMQSNESSYSPDRYCCVKQRRSARHQWNTAPIAGPLKFRSSIGFPDFIL